MTTVHDSSLARDMHAAEQAAIRRATRLLLSKPFVAASGSDAEVFTDVRRHASALAEWFSSVLGYRLVVEQGFARLHKVRGSRLDATRPARTSTKTPFDRRRYALLCLVLAALERVEHQTMLSGLADEVALLAQSTDDVEALDLDRHAERRAFVDAVRLVVSLGALTLTDGEDTRFVDGTGDALYDVERRMLSQLLSSPIPPSLAETADRMSSETYPDTAEGRTRRTRHRLMRALIEDPVCYIEDLDEAERTYLTSQRRWIATQLGRCGLELEVRREGVAAIDEDGALTDVRFPASGTVAHAALLLCDELARRVRAGADHTLSRAALERICTRLVNEHGGRWSKQAEDPAGLLDEALARLAAFDLIRDTSDGVRVMPALARFRPEVPA